VVRDALVSDPSTPARFLEHPLPAGMRDLLPEEATSRRALCRTILTRFSLHGFGLVTPPAFEFADVLERGLGILDPADVLRFVEPESGDVAVLRPDVTPQIARMIATRLRDRPAPYRLAYEGTVLRRRSGRARKHRQIPQVGVELAGVSGPEGDLDMLAVAADALRAAGLTRFTIDLGDAGIVRALLAGATPTDAAAISSALGRKDEHEVSELALAAGLGEAPLLSRVMRLHGGREALVEGARIFRATPAASAVARLMELFDAATACGLGEHLSIDLGEVRGFAYYTGPLFHIYADGPGEALGSGGRYDELLARFGAPMPAVGFAIDLDRLAWALRAAGATPSSEPRAIFVGDGLGDQAIAGGRANALREAGIAAIVMSHRDDAIAYARAWDFAFVVDDTSAFHVTSGVSMPLPATIADCAVLFRRAVTQAPRPDSSRESSRFVQEKPRGE
jgi:ATP phosphoribosyltransferase regulatory subunit